MKFSPRQVEVMALLALGLTDRQIADALTISRSTARNHVSDLIGKLRLCNRTQVALFWAKEGKVVQ